MFVWQNYIILNTLNYYMAEFIKPDFSNIDVDYSLPRISISSVLGMIEEPFDRDRVVELTYNKHFNNPESQYYQKSKEEIIEMWEAKGAESRKYGSMLDDYIGVSLTKTELDVKLFKLDHDFAHDERLQGLCSSFDNFYDILSKSGDTIFVDRERSVYHKVKIQNPLDENDTLEYYVKGRFDALFYNKRTKKWIVIDWKSSGTIDKIPNRWTKKLLGPMSKFPALNYWTYTSQLYFYKKTLIEDGYLPAGTDPDDVVVMIVNLPGRIIEKIGRNFCTHGPAYQFDSELIDRLLEYAIQKDFISNHNKQKESINDTGEKEVEQEQENLENIF